MPQNGNGLITGDLSGTMANIETQLAFLCQAAEDSALCHPGMAHNLVQLHQAALWARREQNKSGN